MDLYNKMENTKFGRIILTRFEDQFPNAQKHYIEHGEIYDILEPSLNYFKAQYKNYDADNLPDETCMDFAWDNTIIFMDDEFAEVEKQLKEENQYLSFWDLDKNPLISSIHLN